MDTGLDRVPYIKILQSLESTTTGNLCSPKKYIRSLVCLVSLHYIHKLAKFELFFSFVFKLKTLRMFKMCLFEQLIF